MPGTCEYEHGYNDTRTEKYDDYFCNRPRTSSSKLCKFHDEHYFQTHEQEVIKLFQKELSEQSPDKTKPIYFIGCNIPAIEVINIKQVRPVYFVNTKFHGNVDFFNIQLTSVNFSNAHFFGNFYLSNVNSNEIFLFSKAKFENDDSKVTFKECDLNLANFSLTTFDSLIFKDSTLNRTKFRTTTIKDKLSISECTFSGKSDFSDCHFLGESIFSLTSFHTDTIFQYAHFTNIVRYHNVDFKEQQLVIFNGDLSNVSFIGTDITRIKFSDKILWNNNDRYSILDARELINDPQNFNLSSVLSVYRNLRENYEFYLMYEEAGQFFVKEMELKRIYFEDPNDRYQTKIKKWRRYFSVTNCYNILSTYGESFKRISLWSIALFSLALAYFFICPDIVALNKSQPLGEIDYAVKLLNDPSFRLEISLERTFGSLFQITTGGLAEYIVRIASLPILGTMFIVLRRRFERRFRH